MKTNAVAVISDVHGNYEALQTVLQKIARMGITKIFCLGDVIGYGVDGKKCIKKLRELDCEIIMGNHEAMFLHEIGSDNCSELGRLSVRWHQKYLAGKISLVDLPLSVEFQGLIFTHSALGDYGYCKNLNTVEDILHGFQTVESGRVVFYGHTHRPRITVVKDGGVFDQQIKTNVTIQAKGNETYYINVGSVGQQRDESTDASFATCHFRDRILEIRVHRVNYPSYRTYKKIANYPELIPIAGYLIREPWRRRVYERLSNRRFGILRKISNPRVK